MDATLFVVGAYSFPPSVQNYSDFLEYNFGPYAATINETYAVQKFNSTPFPAFYALVSVFTDYAYKCPAHRALLKADQNGIDTWSYIWGHQPSCAWYSSIPNNPQVLQILNATHTAELPFVWSNLDNLPLPNGTCNLTSFERELSADIVAAWTSMAANGSPDPGKVQWPAFRHSSPDGLIVGNNSITTGRLDYTACEFWDQINDGIFNATMAQGGNSTVSQPSSGGTSSSTPSASTSTSSVATSTQSSGATSLC